MSVSNCIKHCLLKANIVIGPLLHVGIPLLHIPCSLISNCYGAVVSLEFLLHFTCLARLLSLDKLNRCSFSSYRSSYTVSLLWNNCVLALSQVLS